MKYILMVASILIGCAIAHAADTKDFLIHPGTDPVALTGGDSPLTSSVSCSSNAVATQLIAARTDRSRRKVCFENTGNTTVKIGSSTLPASDLYILGEATNSAIVPIYCTNSSGAYYCNAVNVTTNTVNVLEETQSIP